MKRGKMDEGFTLVESLAAWTILLIAITIFLKCMNMAGVSLGKGTELQKQCVAALESAELGKEPVREKKTELIFHINGTTMSMEAVILEYGLSGNGAGGRAPVTLKTIVPVPQQKSEDQGGQKAE